MINHIFFVQIETIEQFSALNQIEYIMIVETYFHLLLYIRLS